MGGTGKNELKRARCFNHAGREAAARCPSCGRDFCRECVTEHDGKMLCKNCLDERTAKKSESGPSRLRRLAAGAACALLFAAGFLSAWLFFYWTGKALASIPQKYHITEVR